jgi:large subunit ribosomal protein L10
VADVGKLAQKQGTVEQLKSELDKATIAIVADYRGLTVAELTELRRELFKQDAQFTVAKNTLTKHALKGTGMSVLNDALKGPTALLIGRADQVAPVKTLTTFLTKNKKPNEIRGGYLDGKLLSRAEVEQLAKLPPIEELRGKLVGAINSPLSGTVAALSSPQRGLVNVLDQYAKKLQEQQSA